MAQLTHRRHENVAGDIFVDDSCIDCDTCRWMAPQVFERVAGQSAVTHQPETETLRLQSLQALLSCPTASIGTTSPPKDIKAAQQSFPLPIAPGVYHCGYHSEKFYAAASYFITHPEGNILVDSPRFAGPLVRQMEAMGGVRYLYLTHRDDVADHQAFHNHFDCDRLLHEADITPSIGSVEIPLTGIAVMPWLTDLQIIPVPGHTPGHTVLHYQNQFLFTGDHLAKSGQGNYLTAFRRYCWYSWPQQIASMERLLDFKFTWVLPGHGRRYQAPRPVMQEAVQRCISWMKSAA